jgi:hypothetical protein
MNLYKAILDIAKQLIYLDSLIYGRVVLHLPVVVHIKASVNHTSKEYKGNTHYPRIS